MSVDCKHHTPTGDRVGTCAILKNHRGDPKKIYHGVCANCNVREPVVVTVNGMVAVAINDLIETHKASGVRGYFRKVMRIRDKEKDRDGMIFIEAKAYESLKKSVSVTEKKTVKATRIAKHKYSFARLWDMLHIRPLVYKDAESENAWHKEFEPLIPQASCGCRQHFSELKIKFPFDYSSPLAYAASIWKIHCEVNRAAHGDKYVDFTWEQCLASRYPNGFGGGDTVSSDKSIYVQIASYRDPELQYTIKDLFDKAVNPNRIMVGVCLQSMDSDPPIAYERPLQVRVYRIDARASDGVCLARHITQQMWRGEAYTLQIDSHTRFADGWDELLIAELRVCESDKPVISSYPPPYTPPNNLTTNPQSTISVAKDFQADGNIRCCGNNIGFRPKKPMCGAFISAGFMFASGNIILEVPYDPFMSFDQEEISYSVRLFTHGWDVFSPTRPDLIYHYYVRDSSVRPNYWQDHMTENAAKIKLIGLARFNHLTGYAKSTDPCVLFDLDKYGLGSLRSLEQFSEYAGVDFRLKISTEKAKRGLFASQLG